MPAPAVPPFDYLLLRETLGSFAPRFDVEHRQQCDSTNAQLLASPRAAGSVLVCDEQLAGRGRRGRRWVSAPGSSLTFSLLWRLPRGRSATGLSLAVSVGIVSALETLGIEGTGLKWPNDIWLKGRKLGGVLIEALPERSNPGLVIGIGLNLRSSPGWQTEIGRTPASLDETGPVPPRETVLAHLLKTLHVTLETFGLQGFDATQDIWNSHNALRGQQVLISQENTEWQAECGNVDSEGALTLHLPDGSSRHITAGDISLIPLEP
ncbi:MAG: biotin--[acetyl-CoA-carboxylase] ligase [Candidatus Dactylopiibacterium carminicum]|nr:MAG: biotin--[acetyl-CoA-carboxylase] ligase [Candidatus Dactylopiibacterium carminicum]